MFSIGSEIAVKIVYKPFINFWTMNFDSDKNSGTGSQEWKPGKKCKERPYIFNIFIGRLGK